MSADASGATPDRRARRVPFAARDLALALLGLLGLAGPGAVRAASDFPDIPVWVRAGAWQDSSLVNANRCVGSYRAPLAESLVSRPRSVAVRFLRDRRAEARPDFGGYRVYRMTNSPDSSRAVLIRRFSRNFGSDLTWSFSILDTNTLQYMCRGAVVDDSIVTFMDPDSNGQYRKVCRRRDPPDSPTGRCLSPGDSVFVLVAPPGPHDGFLTWYSITYERRNTTDPDYEDLFLPDESNPSACGTPGVPSTCPNLNHKLRNLAGPVEPTSGPTVNLERVLAVPNPYRGNEVWDQPGQNEIHFINLPARSTIKIYTVAGDLVREIQHNDPVRDFARWDLRNGAGRAVSAGIYVYRVESGSFQFQNRLVVIR
jgi:hypothetical protein